MDILFPQSQISAFQDKINLYISSGFTKLNVPAGILFRYVEPTVENYPTVRALQEEGIIFTGFPAYMRLSKTAYENNDVPVGVSFSEELDANGDPTGNQKTWQEWQPQPTIINQADTEVIIPTTYQSQSATVEDLEIFDEAVDIVDIVSLQELNAEYLNDADWIAETPLEKTATYYISNWQIEAFDFLHAQKLVKRWFDDLPGGTVTDKFLTLDNVEKRNSIRWGIYDTNEWKGLIEATITNRNNRLEYENWHQRRAVAARRQRFDDAFAYLQDIFKIGAVRAKLDAMLTYELKEFYIYHGNSNDSSHLIVNLEINPTFWGNFIASNVAYSDVDLNFAKLQVEKILTADKYGKVK